MEKLYVLAGKARSGKDSVASIIEKYYEGKKVVIYPCTLYLKRYVSQIYGWNGSEEDKPRSALQNLGRDIKEKYPDFFISRMREDINFLRKSVDIIIVTGVRLQKELEFLKNEFDGILIKVMKNEVDSSLTLQEQNDITEVDVDNYNEFDYIIENNSDLKSLEEKTKKLLREE